MNNHYKKSHQPKSLSAYSWFRLLIGIALVQTFFVEIIQRESLILTLYWLSDKSYLYLLNAFLVLLIDLFFLSLLGSLRGVVFVSSITLLFLSVINMVKKQFLGDPLFPWDFKRMDQAFNLLPKLSFEIMMALTILAIVVIILLFINGYLIPRCRIGLLSRSVLVLGVIIIIPFLIFYRHTPLETAFKKAEIEHIFWLQSENSLQNGFLLGFTMNLENTMIFKPNEYNSEKIGEIIQNYNPSVPTLKTDRIKTQPNIIFILNEAFWDPTKLSNVKFSEDPIPYFHKLRSQYLAGTMVSPVYGGYTANVEFEILTGLSTKYLPQGAIAYQQYLNNPIPSLPLILNEHGYSSIAIHPYHDWFYQRNMVYPLLGFDHFYSLNDFKQATVKGEYTSDLDVSTKILEEIKATEQPAFIFAVTMQNHGPYSEKRYDRNEISVSSNISEQGAKILETYAQGLKDADNALQVLVEQLKQSNEPTAIIFLGDHLPYLGKEYLVYKEAGYIHENENKWSVQDNLNMKSVPFVIWSNYEIPVRKNNNMTLSSQFLGLKILDIAHIPDNFVFSFIRNLSKELPVYNRSVYMGTKDQITPELSEKHKKSEDEYWLLEYDILFGKQHYRFFIE